MNRLWRLPPLPQVELSQFLQESSGRCGRLSCLNPSQKWLAKYGKTIFKTYSETHHFCWLQASFVPVKQVFFLGKLPSNRRFFLVARSASPRLGRPPWHRPRRKWSAAASKPTRRLLGIFWAIFSGGFWEIFSDFFGGFWEIFRRFLRIFFVIKIGFWLDNSPFRSMILPHFFGGFPIAIARVQSPAQHTQRGNGRA